MLNNVSELRSLLGGLSYYRKFLPNLSKRLQPITRLLKKDVPFSFDAEMEAVVREILKVLTKPPVLVYPDFKAARDGSRKLRSYCDTSAAGFGATLVQPQKDSTVRPIVYLSRAVQPNEQGWAPIEKEAGCIAWAIKRLRQCLFLIPFDIYTDYLPLTSLLSVGVSNARVQQWVQFLTAYNYRIIHRKGAAHGNADMLPRLRQPATEADAQGSCSITNPEEHAVYFVGASGMWPKSIPPSAFNVFIETGFARLLSAPDYSYDKSRNQYLDTKTWRNMYFIILLQPGTRYVRECFGRRNYQYVQYSGTVIPELRWLQLQSQPNASHSKVLYHCDDLHASDDYPES